MFRLVSDVAVFDFIGDETSEHNRTKTIESADGDAASIGVGWQAALAELTRSRNSLQGRRRHVEIVDEIDPPGIVWAGVR